MSSKDLDQERIEQLVSAFMMAIIDSYEIIPNRNEHTWELYLNEHYYGSFVYLADAYRKREQLASAFMRAIREHYLRGPISHDQAYKALNALASYAAIITLGCDGPRGEAHEWFLQAFKQQLETNAQFC